jgi:transposase
LLPNKPHGVPRVDDRPILNGIFGSYAVSDSFRAAFRVKHWGARTRRDTYRGYNGYVLERNNRPRRERTTLERNKVCNNLYRQDRHRTFRLSSEGFREPIERFQAALHETPERIALREIGETFVLP